MTTANSKFSWIVDRDWRPMTTNKKRRVKVTMKINPKELMMNMKIISTIKEKVTKNQKGKIKLKSKTGKTMVSMIRKLWKAKQTQVCKDHLLIMQSLRKFTEQNEFAKNLVSFGAIQSLMQMIMLCILTLKILQNTLKTQQELNGNAHMKFLPVMILL